MIQVIEPPIYKGEELIITDHTQVYVCDLKDFDGLEAAIKAQKIKAKVHDPVPHTDFASKVARDIEDAISPFERPQLFRAWTTPTFQVFKAVLTADYNALLREYLSSIKQL